MIDLLRRLIDDWTSPSTFNQRSCRVVNILLIVLLLCFGHWYYLHGFMVHAMVGNIVRISTWLFGVLVATGFLAYIMHDRNVDTAKRVLAVVKKRVLEPANRMLDLRFTVVVLSAVCVVIVLMDNRPSYIVVYEKITVHNEEGALFTLLAHIDVPTSGNGEAADNRNPSDDYLVHNSSRRMVFWIPRGVGDDSLMIVTARPAELYHVTRRLAGYTYGFRGSHRLVKLDSSVVKGKLLIHIPGPDRRLGDWSFYLDKDVATQCGDKEELLTALDLSAPQCRDMLWGIFGNVLVNSEGQVARQDSVVRYDRNEGIDDYYGYCYGGTERGTAIELTVRQLDEEEIKNYELQGSRSLFCAGGKTGGQAGSWFIHPAQSSGRL